MRKIYTKTKEHAGFCSVDRHGKQSRFTYLEGRQHLEYPVNQGHLLFQARRERQAGLPKLSLFIRTVNAV